MINENMNVCLRKFKMPKEQAFQYGALLMQFCDMKMIGKKTIEWAFRLSATYQFSYYDSLIVASALENDCTILHHSQLIENRLKIINPFV